MNGWYVDDVSDTLVLLHLKCCTIKKIIEDVGLEMLQHKLYMMQYFFVKKKKKNRKKQ